jgi:hypothetical protein
MNAEGYAAAIESLVLALAVLPVALGLLAAWMAMD